MPKGLNQTSDFLRIYILPVEPLFEALSYCASLHPSEAEDEGGGHPFAGVGPFGTGAPRQENEDQTDTAGAFDDAEEGNNNEETNDVQLSETGRVRNGFQTPDSRYRPY